MAQVLEITNRNDERARYSASLGHFESREVGPIPSEIVIQHDHITPYCLDHDSRRLIFTDLPPELDLTTVPFAHSDQWRRARRLIAVPYEELHALSKQVPLPSRLVFVFNASRSGTTLLNRILNQMDGVCSFAELDFFTNLNWLDQVHQDRDELADLLCQCVRLFAYPNADQIVGFKFRHSCVEIADLFHRVFPAAKNLFMYRNAIDWSASWRRLAIEGGSIDDVDRDEVRKHWVWVTERTRSNLGLMLGAGAETVPSLTAQLLQWIDSIEGYLRAYEQGVPIVALSYEDLNEHPTETLALVLEYLGIPRAQLELALLGFDGDSQAGTVMQRRGGKPNTIELDDSQKRTVIEALAKHPRQLVPDPILPGTLGSFET